MNELPFRADFTERVFAQARRRRNLRRGGAAAFAALLLGGAVASGMFRPMQNLRPAVRPVAALDLVYGDEVRTEPVDYMFPEAAALTAFSESYAGLAESPVFDDLEEDR